VDLFLNLLEDDLIVPIVAGLFEDSCKKKLIQTSNLIDVNKDSLSFFPTDNFLVDQGRLEIRDDDA
jgi:hypothetical protein